MPCCQACPRSRGVKYSTGTCCQTAAASTNVVQCKDQYPVLSASRTVPSKPDSSRCCAAHLAVHAGSASLCAQPVPGVRCGQGHRCWRVHLHPCLWGLLWPGRQLLLLAPHLWAFPPQERRIIHLRRLCHAGQHVSALAVSDVRRLHARWSTCGLSSGIICCQQIFCWQAGAAHGCLLGSLVLSVMAQSRPARGSLKSQRLPLLEQWWPSPRAAGAPSHVPVMPGRCCS